MANKGHYHHTLTRLSISCHKATSNLTERYKNLRRDTQYTIKNNNKTILYPNTEQKERGYIQDTDA